MNKFLSIPAFAIALSTGAIAYSLPARADYVPLDVRMSYVDFGQAAYHPAPALGYSYYQSPPPAVFEVPPPAFYAPAPVVYEVPAPAVIERPTPYYSY